MLKNKLLIDGDILVYRIGFATQTDGIAEPEYHAFYLINKLMQSLMKRFNTYKFKMFLTADNKSNFRFSIAKTLPYKGNRDKKYNPNAPDKPINYEAIRKYLISKWFAIVVEGSEADDAMGIYQMKCIEENTFRPIIVSLDKDLDQIPGYHYNFVTDSFYKSEDPGELYLSEDNKKLKGVGYKWFYAQMLLGDKADNIPGLNGYGPAKTFKLLEKLETEKELYRCVKELYIKKLSKTIDLSCIYDRLYEVADLLWIHRSENDFKSAYLKNLEIVI